MSQSPDLEKRSAFQTHIGFEVTGWEVDVARVEAPIAPFMSNRQGIPHGGVHATLLDSAMGFAGCYTGDPDRQQNALTLSLTVNYVGQAQGNRLIAEGRRIGGGRKTYFAEGRLTDDLGNLVATASGTFRYRS